MKRNVLTIAVGKRVYVEMAVALARSFFRWNGDTDISFYLVTDLPDLVPGDVKAKSTTISVKTGEIGAGFSSKLHLDQLAPQGKTIFIDSDCLIFENIDYLFDKFEGNDVSVVGGYISTGEWFGDIGVICKKFALDKIPKFNGGLYYIKKGIEATKVYDTARQLEARYDEIGFLRLRNRPNDEVLMALAMQLNGQKPLDDDGTILSDPQACPGKYYIDVINGKRLLVNPPYPHPQHQDWYPFERVSPAIVHFLDFHAQHYPYKREIYRLGKYALGKTNLFTPIWAKLHIEYPDRLKLLLKTIMRPVYHLLFGFRKIKASPRL